MSQRHKTKPTEFKYVKKIEYEKGKVSFIAQMQAAIAVDKYLISQGKEPVNILVRK